MDHCIYKTLFMLNLLDLYLIKIMCDYSNPFSDRLTTANLIKRFSGHRGSPTLVGLKTPAVSIPTALPVH